MTKREYEEENCTTYNLVIHFYHGHFFHGYVDDWVDVYVRETREERIETKITK